MRKRSVARSDMAKPIFFALTILAQTAPRLLRLRSNTTFKVGGLTILRSNVI